LARNALLDWPAGRRNSTGAEAMMKAGRFTKISQAEFCDRLARHASAPRREDWIYPRICAYQHGHRLNHDLRARRPRASQVPCFLVGAEVSSTEQGRTVKFEGNRMTRRTQPFAR
jgi:hypothetical protein